jgi:hypothetical protein
MADFVQNVGTLGDPLVSILQDANGPLDIPAGSSVKISIGMFDNPPIVSLANATVVDPGAPINSPDRGKVMYTELSADVASEGIYGVRWWLTKPGQQAVPYPEGDPLTLLIMRD